MNSLSVFIVLTDCGTSSAKLRTLLIRTEESNAAVNTLKDLAVIVEAVDIKAAVAAVDTLSEMVEEAIRAEAEATLLVLLVNPINSPLHPIINNVLLMADPALVLEITADHRAVALAARDPLDLPDLQAVTDHPEMTDRKDLTDNQAQMLLVELHRPRTSASIVRQDHPAQQVERDLKDLPDRLETQDQLLLADMAAHNQDHPDPQDLPDLMEIQDRQDNAAQMDKSPKLPEVKDLPVRPAPLDKPDHPARPELAEDRNKDLQARPEMLDHLVTQEEPVHREEEAKMADQAEVEGVVIALRPVPLLGISGIIDNIFVPMLRNLICLICVLILEKNK